MLHFTPYATVLSNCYCTIFSFILFYLYFIYLVVLYLLRIIYFLLYVTVFAIFCSVVLVLFNASLFHLFLHGFIWFHSVTPYIWLDAIPPQFISLSVAWVLSVSFRSVSISFHFFSFGSTWYRFVTFGVSFRPLISFDFIEFHLILSTFFAIPFSAYGITRVHLNSFHLSDTTTRFIWKLLASPDVALLLLGQGFAAQDVNLVEHI